MKNLVNFDLENIPSEEKTFPEGRMGYARLQEVRADGKRSSKQSNKSRKISHAQFLRRRAEKELANEQANVEAELESSID